MGKRDDREYPARPDPAPEAYADGHAAGGKWARRQASFAELERLDAERHLTDNAGPFLRGFAAAALRVWEQLNQELAR